MTTILQVDASARIQGSQSRSLSRQFIESWQVFNPEARVIYRNLARDPIPHLDEIWVEAYETQPEARSPQMNQAIALSDILIDELFAADRYVFAMPMYNLTVPSVFKAYLDQVIRRDRTLTFDEMGKPSGALKNKKALIITTRKFNYRSGTDAAARNFLEPYLKAILGVIGVIDVTIIVADELAQEAVRDQALARAIAELMQLAGEW